MRVFEKIYWQDNNLHILQALVHHFGICQVRHMALGVGEHNYLLVQPIVKDTRGYRWCKTPPDGPLAQSYVGHLCPAIFSAVGAGGAFRRRK